MIDQKIDVKILGPREEGNFRDFNEVFSIRNDVAE